MGFAALLRPLAPTLVTLCLSGCAAVGTATLDTLDRGAAPKLRELDLSCCAARLGAVVWLRLPQLRRLDVSHNNTTAFAESFTSLPRYSLNISGSFAGSFAVSMSGKISADLVELSAEGCGLDDAACLRLLRDVPRLRVLSVADNNRLTAAAVAGLSVALPYLEWLDLSDTDLESAWSGGSGGGSGGGGPSGPSGKGGEGDGAAVAALACLPATDRPGAAAAAALTTLPPGLRTVRLLRCPWLTQQSIWRLEQARAAAPCTEAATACGRGCNPMW